MTAALIFMDSSLLFLLNGWTWLALIGCALVIPGVILESAEYVIKWGKKKKCRQFIDRWIPYPARRECVCAVKILKPIILPIETFGFALLVIGLAVEIFGSFKSDQTQSQENAVMEATNTVLNLQIEELHSNNLVLEKELQPRTISIEQITNFIRVSVNIPRNIPITVHASTQGDDTLGFATQIRLMLDKAGFMRDGSQNGVEYDLYNNSPITGYFYRKIGDEHTWPSVIFAMYGTNEIFSVDSDIYNSTNEVVGLSPNERGAKAVYEGIEAAFRRIGISTEWETAFWLKTNEIEIYIPPKIN
jgi:hypothetical protein